MAFNFVSRRKVVLSLIFLLNSVLYQQGLSLAQPCQNLAIIRLDTQSDVTHSIVLLNDNSTIPAPSFRCQDHHGSTTNLRWLPSPQTEYSGVLRELQSIMQTFLSRYRQQISGDLVVSGQGQQEGFYLCTNVFNFGCYLGVFKRSSLAARNVRFNHIYNTGFEVSWDPPVHSAFIKGYQLTVATQDGHTIVQKQYSNAKPSYTHVITCVAPGKAYSVNVEALYNFQEKGFYSVSETVVVSTPADSSIKECTVEINPPNVTVWAEEKPRALKVAWDHSTLPPGVKIAKNVIQYKKVADNDYVETEVQGSDSEISLNGLEFGTAYLVRVAMHPEDRTFNGSILPTKYLGVFSTDVVATTFNLPRSPVLIGSPTDSNSDSITVGWNTDVTHELPVTHVVSIAAQDGNEVQRVHVSAHQGEASVSGLLGDTEYLVTVWAENSIGRSNNHSLLVHTRRAAIIEAPMNLQAYVLSANSVEVTWNRSGIKTTISNTSYEITFEATNNNEHHQRKGFFLTSNQLFIVQNLHPFSEYLISVTSIDQTGARSKAASVKAVTFAAAPSGPPQLIAADHITSRYISLSWTEPAAEQRNGIVTSYIVHYRVDNSFIDEDEIEKGPCDLVSAFTLDNLAPNRAYHFKVAAVTVGGRGIFSDWIEVITSEEAPGPVVGLLVVPQSSTSGIQIQWSPPLEVNGVLVGYLVVVREFEGPDATAPLYSLEIANTSVTVSSHGLEPGKPYQVSVTATTGGGEGPLVQQVFFIKELVPDVSVSEVKIHRITSTSLKVSWNELSLHEAKGTPTYRVSCWKGNTSNVTTKETVEPMVVLEGLDSSSVYSIAVQVKTAGGMGPFSQPISVVLVSQAGGPVLASALTATAQGVDVGTPSGETMSDIFNFSKFSIQIVFVSGLGIGVISTVLLAILLFLLYRCSRVLGICCSARHPSNKSEVNEV